MSIRRFDLPTQTVYIDDPLVEELQRVKLAIESAVRDIRSEHYPSMETTNGRWEACPTCSPGTKRWPCAAGCAADDLEALL